MGVVEFLSMIEVPLKAKHIPLDKGKTIYTSLLGTATDLTPVDNVKASISGSYFGSLPGYNSILMSRFKMQILMLLAKS